ncbi:MAG: Asp-tRNA(Asn)/Glu-tRNA(Gln) amidotransferase subunit GatC [Pirellulaceae bacterium]|nr:Asp-tRNA(Asn)/Glu-tRNA(Gln) amidotransferase subunit GatC [Planctomycetaceae bacterium]HIK93299.1 Asp-tRNA(Asn)/Glu-tRNA(Gln) amidotransferase subunit GatC [Planctomycetota bacterium]
MAFSHDEVLKVARLAQLDLAQEEVETFAAQLGHIVQYIEQLDELDTTDVEPMAHGAGVTNVFREDQVQPSLDREAALANAPNRDAECFRVPPVL